MKKVRTCLVAAALTGAVLTVPAGAASLNLPACEGSGIQVVPMFQSGSCELATPNLWALCPEGFLPSQLPGLPGDAFWPDYVPDRPGGDVNVPDGEDALSHFEAEVARLVNNARQENGLSPLSFSSELSRVARMKSQDMVDNSYFSHTSPTYGSPFEMLTAFGISYSTAGENIAYGQRTPQEVVDTWMNSSGHRANILNAAYTQIGVGFVSTGNHWTQLFIG